MLAGWSQVRCRTGSLENPSAPPPRWICSLPHRQVRKSSQPDSAGQYVLCRTGSAENRIQRHLERQVPSRPNTTTSPPALPGPYNPQAPTPGRLTSTPNTPPPPPRNPSTLHPPRRRQRLHPIGIPSPSNPPAAKSPPRPESSPGAAAPRPAWRRSAASSGWAAWSQAGMSRASWAWRGRRRPCRRRGVAGRLRSRPGGCGRPRCASAPRSRAVGRGLRPARRSGRPRRPVPASCPRPCGRRTGRAGRPGLGRVAGGGQLVQRVAPQREAGLAQRGGPGLGRQHGQRAGARVSGWRSAVTQPGGSASVAASSTSGPDSSTASARASATLRAMGPSTSSVSDSGRLPARLIRPVDGL